MDTGPSYLYRSRGTPSRGIGVSPHAVPVPYRSEMDSFLRVIGLGPRHRSHQLPSTGVLAGEDASGRNPPPRPGPYRPAPFETQKPRPRNEVAFEHHAVPEERMTTNLRQLTKMARRSDRLSRRRVDRDARLYHDYENALIADRLNNPKVKWET